MRRVTNLDTKRIGFAGGFSSDHNDHTFFSFHIQSFKIRFAMIDLMVLYRILIYFRNKKKRHQGYYTVQSVTKHPQLILTEVIFYLITLLNRLYCMHTCHIIFPVMTDTFSVTPLMKKKEFKISWSRQTC